MQSGTQAALVSKKKIWAGRAISALVVLFLIFDSLMKFVKPAPVVTASAHLGLPVSAVCRHRDCLIGLYYPLCHSADLYSWRDPADRLFGRRSRYPLARG